MRLAPILCLSLAAPIAFASPGPRIVEHDVQVRLDPYRSRLEATDRFTIVGYQQSLLRFLLNEDLEIASLRIEGRDLRWREEAFDRAHWVDLPAGEGGAEGRRASRGPAARSPPAGHTGAGPAAAHRARAAR